MDITETPEVSANVQTLAVDFCKKVLAIQSQKKALDAEIKDIKQRYSEMGVAVTVVLKALANVQKRKKLSASQADELDTLEELLEKDAEINSAIFECN